MLKFYYHPSPNPAKVALFLEESGLPYETETVDLKTKLTGSGQDYWTINPKGYVPALLLDSGELLTEGPAIVQYVADQAPDKHLAPANGTLARYQLQAWLTFISTELHKNFSPLFNPATPDSFKALTKDRLLGRLAWVDSQLAGKDWLMGSDFTVADGYLYTVTNWPSRVGVDMSGFPNIAAFRARAGARPGVQAALRAEGLI